MISEPLNPPHSTSGERVRTISLSGSWDRVGLAAVLLLGVIGVLSAPATWAADSVSNSSSGLIPRAGPTAAGRGGFGGGEALYACGAGS